MSILSVSVPLTLCASCWAAAGGGGGGAGDGCLQAVFGGRLLLALLVCLEFCFTAPVFFLLGLPGLGLLSAGVKVVFSIKFHTSPSM